MKKPNSHEISYSSIRITGDFLPPDFLHKIINKEMTRSTKNSSNTPSQLSLKSKLHSKWEQALHFWKNRSLQDKENSPSMTKTFLEDFFRNVLDFNNLFQCDKIETAERVYPISHQVLDSKLPIWLCPFCMDTSFSRSGYFIGRRSPFSLLQQYVNNNDTLGWGLIADESKIRILRQNPSLSKHSYIEVDLAQLFEEGGFNEFCALWILFNASRFNVGQGIEKTNDWDLWCKEGSEAGDRIRMGMRDGIGKTLQLLGQGFLEHPHNTLLREAITQGHLTTNQYYTQIQKFAYRLIFLLFLEDRQLLHTPCTEKDTRLLYSEGYSLSSLRNRSTNRLEYDNGHDLWLGLKIVFQSLSQGNDSLGLPGLGGLFNIDQCPSIEGSLIENSILLQAVYNLGFFKSGHSLCRINYRDMGTEEIGSIYESLLELHPHIDLQSWIFELVGLEGDTAKGNKRKLTGSYYTPQVLVNALLNEVLQPVIDETIANNPHDPEEALLNLKIIDPACGSGHFILGAAHRIALTIVSLNHSDNHSELILYQDALRQVVRRCIFGVDKNPMAVELCRTILWMESIVPGKPLPFLEANIKCGDSLLGILKNEELKSAIPATAYKPHKLDDKNVCKSLSIRNKNETNGHRYLSVIPNVNLQTDEIYTRFTELPEDNLEQISTKRNAWLRLKHSPELESIRRKANLLYGAYFAVKKSETEDLVPTTNDFLAVEEGQPSRPGVEEYCESLAEVNQFFHWPVEFPDIMKKGGFDVVLGNPPWEVNKMTEQEYFDSRDPHIAKLSGAKRKAEIKKLEESNDPLFTSFEETKRRYDLFNLAIKNGDRYPLVSKGQINLYQLFAELASNLYSLNGRAGIIVPTGIATDFGNRFFIREMMDSKRLYSLYDFENREKLFPIDSRIKFCLLTLSRNVEKAKAAFYLTHPDQLADDRRHVTLTSEDIELVNPNTRTIPLCRSWMDFQIMKKIYHRWPVFYDESKGDAGNPWNASFSRLFDMTLDSHHFSTKGEMLSIGAKLDGNVFITPNGERWLPLYEAKMMHIYDHRWGSYDDEGKECVDVDSKLKENPNYQVMPRYWVPEPLVDQQLESKNWNKKWMIGWRDIASPTNQRTLIPCVLPKAGIANNIGLVFLDVSNKELCAWLACTSSLISDYLVRMKAGGTHLNFYILRQLPVPTPDDFTEEILSFLIPRLVELACISEDIKSFGNDLGCSFVAYFGSIDQRQRLQAELDAYIARWYGLNREELTYILDPKEACGKDFPSETFAALKNAEQREYGEYRTKRLVLEAWDQQEAGIESEPIRREKVVSA